jgi:hypothetical protein
MTATTVEDRAPSGRATSLDAFRAITGLMVTPEGLSHGLGMTLLPTDIIITPFGKNGTTWLQQMCHTLRTRGDMDFDDISAVVPWIETSADLGLDLNADQKAEPRLFKSHLDANRVPAGGRYINSCRDPKDALYSMYKFMEGWFLEPGAVSLDEFARGTFIAAAADDTRGNYWSHLKSWWLRRDDPDVLFMAFEHMKGDLPGTIERVATFMQIDLDDELFAITQEHTSLAFMKKHSDRFDDRLMREHSIAVAGLSTDIDSSKVRSGQVGESRQQLSAEVAEELDKIWVEKITGELGFTDYASMIAALKL